MNQFQNIYTNIYMEITYILGFPGGSDCKESTCNAGDLGSIPGLGRSPGGGHGTILQYSCLENPHGRRSLQAIVLWLAKSRTQLSNWAHTHHMAQQFHAEDIPQNLTELKQNLYRNLHSSIIHSSQKGKTNQTFISWFVDKQNVIHPFNGILLSYRKEWRNDLCHNMNEP